MSSNGQLTADPSSFRWHGGLDLQQYITVSYVVETAFDPETVAVALAQEQSAVSDRIPHTGRLVDVETFAARVLSVAPMADSQPSGIRHYSFDPEELVPDDAGWYRVEIAYPALAAPMSLTHMWTVIGAEVHRFGFVGALQVEDFSIPSRTAARGPRFGVQGIRDLLDISGRPLLCRSARPAIGSTDAEMAEMAELVLSSGFDVVKDDELTLARDAAAAAKRTRAIVGAVRRSMDRTGERKLYVANAIGSRSEAFAIADAAVTNGAGALLASPALQGIEICGELADEFGVPILCHNTWSDVLSRHPRFGVSDAAIARLQSLSGADWVMAPGNFATSQVPVDVAFLDATRKPSSNTIGAMPILAGGKVPERSAEYLDAMASPDVMLIVATAIDTHPEGMAVGARAFRDAIEEAWGAILPARSPGQDV